MNIQSSTRLSDEAGIRSLIDQRVKAAVCERRRGCDLRVSRLDYVPFTLEPPLVSTMTGAKEYDSWFATWQGPIGTEIRDLDIAVSGDLGISHSLNLMSGRSVGRTTTSSSGIARPSASARSMAPGRSRTCIRSVPFYMDGSFGAAIDLKP